MPKPKIKKQAVSFRPATAIQRIAEPLIEQHHPHLLQHKVRIEFIFRSDTPKKSGKIVAGSMQIVGSLNAFWARPKEAEKDAPTKRFFAMVISEPSWTNMTEKKRVALVDHQLCHAGASFDPDGNIKLYLRTHDLEEFREVIERNGFWDQANQRFAKSVMDACPQQRLEIEE